MIYTIGSVAVSGHTLTGTGTNFKAPLSMIRVGCTVIVKSDPIQIFSITEIVSETELSVTPAASPDIPAGTAYSILLCDSISVDGLAQDVAEALRYFTGQESEIYAAVEYWKNYGDAAQVEALLTAIQAETAQSTANAQKTEADKKTTEGYKNAAATSATAAKSSQDAAKASETSASNSKTAAATSETNAAKSAADALNYRNQAQGIVGGNIGLGASPRDCPDISGNPSGYIGFMRIREAATGFPSIASGEAYLTGFISGLDGSPTYAGIFQGWNTRSLYTYRWSSNTGPQWTRHVRKDEVSRLYNYTVETHLYAGESTNYLFISNAAWGARTESGPLPLGLNYGGTGGGNAGQARTSLEVMYEQKADLADTDLNTLTGEYSGFYRQKTNSAATTERHYPCNYAGALVVLGNGANGYYSGCTQIYYPYNYSDLFYTRWCNGNDLAWSDWCEHRGYLTILNNIGLGASPRHCSDITVNPSSYIGFLRLTPAGTTGYPDVATEAGDGALSGYICRNDGEPSYSGLFVGSITGSAYTYRYSVGGGVQWQRIPRANDLSRFVQNDSTTRMYGPTGDRFFEIHTNNITGDRYSVFEWTLDTGYLAYLERSADGSQRLQVNGDIHCTTVTQSSDRDLKDNIEVIPDATAAIRKMNGYTYTLKENGLPYAGIIAQEAMEAIPEAVGSFMWEGEELEGPTQDGRELRETARYLNVDYAAVTGLLVQVARETDDRVTALEEENASLRANIAVMDERITKLEALVQQLTGSEE
ncbi:tail fiber domain-containing protein [Escherichia coli]|uniref:tail fiber domain-containing protein n=1 Tax=Escherichia coli TaxID=562 RepID=UPI00211E3488|nr:tail fiber domain-containing protein [Escherichia coli]